MKVIDPGHLYELAGLDSELESPMEMLRFVKRVGDKYPGNDPPGYGGTITQEVIRVLIDRAQYVDRQRPHRRNPMVIDLLREALRQLELRAAEEREEWSVLGAISIAAEPERLPTCRYCGHVECHMSHGGMK